MLSQQRSTGYVLHYLKDLELFVAAEAAAASVSGAPKEQNDQEVLPPGASESLLLKLYRQNKGPAEAGQQQTSIMQH